MKRADCDPETLALRLNKFVIPCFKTGVFRVISGFNFPAQNEPRDTDAHQDLGFRCLLQKITGAKPAGRDSRDGHPTFHKTRCAGVNLEMNRPNKTPRLSRIVSGRTDGDLWIRSPARRAGGCWASDLRPHREEDSQISDNQPGITAWETRSGDILKRRFNAKPPASRYGHPVHPFVRRVSGDVT
jgi:hypothetical protein